jgi:hypothetical protein
MTGIMSIADPSMTDEQINDWREKWTAELAELLSRTPDGLENQTFTFGRWRFGIQRIEAEHK